MTTQQDVALMRLVAQRIAGLQGESPVEAVRRLAALQGQDFPGALTSVALRTTAGRRAPVEKSFDAGEIVRSWPMRGTLHVVAAEDLPWMLDLLGPRLLTGATTRRARLGLTDADIDRARAAAETALSGGRALRRQELLDRLAAAGVDVTGQRGYHLLWFLAQSRTLCLGPLDGGQQVFALLDDWVREPRRLARDEALAELAQRFFTGHGPATVADLARWAGITVRDARTGLAAARPSLASVEVDGIEYLMDPETPDRLSAHRAQARDVFLLPGFDEFVLGYADRRAVLPPEFAPRIVPGGNGMFRATVVHDGRIVGTWQLTGRGARRTVTATPFTSFDDGVEARIAELAANLP